jgi:citrate lyase subunit beta/citryl-CoA lyase
VNGRGEMRPLRTVLFVPGDRRAELDEAAASGADALVIDLEEPRTPCPESLRQQARGVTGDFLREGGEAGAAPGAGGPVFFVRVQAPRTGQTLLDLDAVMGPALHGILVPKVLGPADIHMADALLAGMEVKTGRTIGSTAVYPILETASAIRLAYDIAMASPRVRYMGGAVSRFGDIHQAVGFRWTAEGTETLFLRSKVLIDCRAAGLRYPISGMWGGDVDDHDGLRAWCRHLRDLGYFGMMIGNPRHVPIVNEEFTPSAEEIAYWGDLDRLAADAERDDTGPITYGDPNQGEGHVVHIAHVGSARLNLEWARALGLVPA